MAALERLRPVDEANFVLDRPGQVNVFLVAAVLSKGGFIDAGGAPDMDALRVVVRDRVAAVPQLRRTAVATGRRHRWADAEPHLDEQVRLVDPVEGLAGLESLCGRLMSVPLPWDRPLWELLVVPGAAADGVAVILRMHHALADGMAAVGIMRGLFDPTPEPVPGAEASAPRREGARRPRFRDALRLFGVGVQRIVRTVMGREMGRTVLLGERSSHRAVAFLSVDLDGLRATARRHGATVNDALLTAVACGYRAALTTAREPPPPMLPVSVPVALERRGRAGNQVGVMLVRLPLGAPSSTERIRLIALQTGREKPAARRQGTLELMRGPIGARIMNGFARHQHLVAGFVTNLAGPTTPFTLAGAPVTAIWPVAVLAGNVRLGVAALSYNGRLACTVHFDSENVRGAEFSRAMDGELARMAASTSH